MQPTQSSDSRLRNLDVLRAVAVLLVLVKHFFHLALTADELKQLDPIRPLMRAGWIGVPIFFALSGFLIGNLLFKEYATTGTLNLKRFWIRRGFKIYPAFYLVIFGYSTYLLLFEGQLDWERFFCEVFFITNYGKGGLLGVTWSLAVEEHFYFVFPVLLCLFIRLRPARPPLTGIPRVHYTFQPIVLGAAIMTVVCLLLRLEATSHDPMLGRGTLMTHLRIDALFAGTAMAFIYHTRPAPLVAVFRRHNWWLMIIALCGTYPAFLPEITYGKTFYLAWFPLILSISSLLALGAALSLPSSTGTLPNALAWLGTYSYGIYLCHVPIYRLVNKIVERLPLRPHVCIWVGLAVVAACLGGIMITRLIEIPMLHIRDRFFPRPSNRMEAECTTTT